jgi:hypothetical protein
MAINWAIGNIWNVSIWVYFDTTPLSNNMLKVFSYPHDIDKSKILNTEWWKVKLLKTLTLSKWVIIDDIEGNTNMLFEFDSITWKLNYYTWIWSARKDVIEDILSINFSFKWSTSPNLNKTINYFTNTNIIDY